MPLRLVQVELNLSGPPAYLFSGIQLVNERILVRLRTNLVIDDWRQVLRDHIARIDGRLTNGVTDCLGSRSIVERLVKKG